MVLTVISWCLLLVEASWQMAVVALIWGLKPKKAAVQLSV
jgi:hypothetical protein